MPKKEQSILSLCYLLFALAIIGNQFKLEDSPFKWLSLAVIVLSAVTVYWLRSRSQSLLLRIHSSYFLKTFWMYLLGTVLLVIFSISMIMIGVYTDSSRLMAYTTITAMILLVILYLWSFYRAIKGLVQIRRLQEVNPKSWL